MTLGANDLQSESDNIRHFASFSLKNKSSLREFALRLEILHCPLLQSVYQRSRLQKIPAKNHKGERFQKHIFL